MIINNNAIKIDSNVEPSKALNFGISDVRLVVDILSKLYAYPIRTLVQEYICNGRDAMREANTWGKLPIEITVPNTLEPVFKVRDFGVGISPDRMENIFVNYGSSTKRNTNAQTGGFGIGAKSAFSYTDSFTVTSFFNGNKYLYVAHLGDNGGVNLISTEETSLPNGVEISVGVKPKDIAEFREAVQRCVRFWSEPIKFIGSRDIQLLCPTLMLGNMTAFDCHGGESRTIYLIDGIEYDLMASSSDNYWIKKDISLHAGNSIVAINIPNGHFKIASSRERLENNDDNKAKQDKILADCNAKLDMLISLHINNKTKDLKTRIENRKLYSMFEKVRRLDLDLGNGFFLAKNSVRTTTPVAERYVRRGRRNSTHNEIRHSTMLDLNIVVYTATDKSNTLARKLNYYLESNRNAVLVDADDVAKIPFQDILFTNRIDADALPLPPRKTSQLARKTTRDSMCYLIDKDGTRTQWTIEKLNTTQSPIVFVDQVDDEAKKIAEFIGVITIPKCNKDLVLKKGMTLEQGKKYLLSKNKSDALGIVSLPHNHTKITVLKKFKNRKVDANLLNFLMENFNDFKKEINSLQSEYDSIVKKYPLIKVLSRLSHYEHEAIGITIDEINKQSKEDV